MLGTTVCAGGRLALRASSRTLARTFQSRDRLVQSSLDGLPSQQGFANVRNFWWSKPTTTEVTNPIEPTSPLDPVVQAKTAAPPVTSEGAATSAVAPSQTQAIDPTAVSTPEPVSEVLSASASDIPDVATNIITPLQYGDFAALGLSGWSPSGIISWSFELLQVGTGMPWFYTIIAGTLFWRAILIPSALTSMRNAGRLTPYAGQIQALDEQAKGVKDRAAQMELMLKKQKLIESAGVSLSSMFLPPIVQIVGNFGLFFAVKGMMQLPVQQLAQSGVSFLPDLTATGDYIFPALMVLAMNVQLALSKKELDPTKTTMAHTMNVMRVASLATIPLMSMMPSGLWLSVLTGTALSITQSSLLRVPRIRQALAIPPAPQMAPVTMKDTGRMIVEWYRRTRVDAIANQAANQQKPNWTTLPKGSRTSRRAR